MTLDNLDPRTSALLVIDLQNAFIHDKGTLGISGVDTKRLSANVATLAPLSSALSVHRAGVPSWLVQRTSRDSPSRTTCTGGSPRCCATGSRPSPAIAAIACWSTASGTVSSLPQKPW